MTYFFSYFIVDIFEQFYKTDLDLKIQNAQGILLAFFDKELLETYVLSQKIVVTITSVGC